MNPTVEGPTNPPRFPTELIKAKQVATAEPERNALGMAQKGARKLQRPISTKDKSATANMGERVVPSSARAKAAPSTGIAAWNFRSSLRSELREMRTIAAAATKLGIMTSSPTVVLEYVLDRDLMI
jgi:hypothetical protein